MTQYYYLVASLPMLSFAVVAPFHSRDWLDLCREHVSEADHALLSRIAFSALHPRLGDHAVWRTYAAWETALRNELARQRGQRLGVDPDPFLRDAPFYTGLAGIVKEALGAGTPKAIETELDHRRWSVLEELETGTQFGLGRLIVYRLKLLLLERNQQFRPEPGRKGFTEEYSQILNNTVDWILPPLATEKRND